MDLWPAMLPGWGVRPRKNQNPASAAIIIATSTEAINHVSLRAGIALGASLSCADAAAVRDEDPVPLVAVEADSVGGEETTGAEGDGAASTAALFPDSVSRFNLCRSARISAAC